MRKLICLCLLLIPVTLFAQERIYTPLPQPLQLPPGNTETLPLNHTGSLFGEAFRIANCPDDIDLPFGSCGNVLYGGTVMVDSHLTGAVTISFSDPVDDVTHFTVTHGLMLGDDSTAGAPLGFKFPLRGAMVTDWPDGTLSEGDLNLVTGGVTNLKYRVQIAVSGLYAVHYVMPALGFPVPLEFPGVLGHAWAHFDQRDDGLLDFSFQGSEFLPFGRIFGGEAVRFIAPVCDSAFHCASTPAAGTSAHPHVYISTRQPEGPACAPNCPTLPVNTIQEYTVYSYNTNMGDLFRLDTQVLGGPALAATNLQGRLEIQWGVPTGGTISFVIHSLVPEGLIQEPPDPGLPIHGIRAGLVGQEELVHFPLATYRVQRFVLADDPFNFPQGVLDLNTGRVIGEFSYPGLLGANIPEAVFSMNPGRVPFPFELIALRPPPEVARTTYALFQPGPDGETFFRFSGGFRSTFGTYRFPSPDFNPANSIFTGNQGELDIFLHMQAVNTTDVTTTRIEGSASDLTSSVNDQFSYAFSMPCNNPGADASFTYTNNNSGQFGGTFTLTRLVAVSCMNSITSTSGPGQFDTVTFSGFGTWSKDASDANFRFASVQISKSAVTPYANIIVYMNPDPERNIILSSAHTRPLPSPLP